MGALSHHPNVVPVYETGSVDERLYLVMPLLPDGSLADQLASGPLAPAAVVELGRGLADALAAAHEAGVLHRDVKPANVLRTPHGTYQLADFGVARFVDATQTLGGLLLATVAYAAPEVLDGGPATAASDVYSLGATLHAALRGRPPFESGPGDAPSRWPCACSRRPLRTCGWPASPVRSPRWSNGRWRGNRPTATRAPPRCAMRWPRSISGRPIGRRPERSVGRDATDADRSAPICAHPRRVCGAEGRAARRRAGGRPAAADAAQARSLPPSSSSCS